MKSRIGLVALWATLLSQSADAQMLAVSPGANQGMVTKASCDSCDGGCYGGGGHHSVSGFYGGDNIVWGAQCGMKRGLYPPCPNTCHTTLLGELCCDIKKCVDHGMSHLSCCLFGHAAIGCGHNPCTCGGCGAENYCDSGCCDSGYNMTMQGEPIEASPTPSKGQPDPFQDDPQMPEVQPIPNGSASRNATTHRRASYQQRSTQPTRVKRVTHASTASRPAPKSLEGQSILAKPIRRTATRSRHYAPRRTSLLRTSRGKDLVKTPVARSSATPSLKFR